MNEPMMTARQVAELLCVHENWVYDQAAAGKLPSYKIGGARRFRADELHGWISDHRDPAPATQTATASRPAPPTTRRPARRAAAKPSRRSKAKQPRLFEDR